MVQQLIVNGIIAAAIYALVGVGFGLIYNTGRFFHFAHGAVYAWGAYFCYAANIFWKWPLWLAVIVGVVGAAILGSLIELAVYRPLRRRKGTPLVLLLASLGLFVVFQNLISMIFGDDTKTLRTGEVVEGLPLFGARITPVQITIIAVSAVLILTTWAFLQRSRHGIAIRAVANDPELALISGLDPDRYLLVVFFIGSALAGAGAILISFDTDMVPLMGFNALLMAVVAVIVGGLGSVPGIAIGALLVGLAQNLGVWKLPTQWQDTIVFAILLVFLLFRPQGFLGRKVVKASV